jgi:choline dehydrogenase-like flavoprotein
MCIAEQAPNPASRITLSRSEDRLGVPLPLVDWRLNDLDGRTIEVMIAHVRRALAAGGLGHLMTEGDSRTGALNHHIGTTRMSEDPRAGVVNRDAKVHGVANLFIGGSSVFPTGGVANPTLTITAMSIRLGNHLRGIYRR